VERRSERPGAFCLQPELVVVALKCALNLAFADRYGWQRDELYYAVAGMHLHWFLQEQREEVASMSDLLSVVERASESNILLAEDNLARNPVGDQGAPDAGAPPAAGGSL
jgi:hypothetical protein